MTLDFEKGGGLVPAIVQDHLSGTVLMLGYMNEEALQATLTSGKATFYSRSKKRLWTKGETSGNYLLVKDMKEDCDRDALLIRAQPTGPVCHTGADTCFNEKNGTWMSFLKVLMDVIESRKTSPEEESYVSGLFEAGINKIAQKVGEEAVETIIEAKDSDDSLFLNESADLLFHLMVLLAAKGYRLKDVAEVLEERHQKG